MGIAVQDQGRPGEAADVRDNLRVPVAQRGQQRGLEHALPLSAARPSVICARTGDRKPSEPGTTQLLDPVARVAVAARHPPSIAAGGRRTLPASCAAAVRDIRVALAGDEACQGAGCGAELGDPALAVAEEPRVGHPHLVPGRGDGPARSLSASGGLEMVLTSRPVAATSTSEPCGREPSADLAPTLITSQTAAPLAAIANGTPRGSPPRAT